MPLGQAALGHFKCHKSAPRPLFRDVPFRIFSTGRCNSVILLRSGAVKRMLIKGTRQRTDYEKSTEEEINRSYNKNGEIAFSKICGINWSFCSLY